MIENDDNWNAGDPYEYFMGRWSKLVAPVFLDWLKAAHHLSWLDVGCGTGALSEAIYHKWQPSSLHCMDLSPEFLEKAKAKNSFKAEFFVGNAAALPFAKDAFDVVVSGLAFNFFPDPDQALVEMHRVSKADGRIAAYVWDYSGRMDFLRYFWDVACEVDDKASTLDEGNRFPICNADRLRKLFEEAGLNHIQTADLDVDTVFTDFNDYWAPFLGGQGPAPGYLASLSGEMQERIKQILQERLPTEANGAIRLVARAIAVQGSCNP
jgi:SAM-dependent methyltransferase